MERLICRILTATGKEKKADVRTRAFLATKWVDWRYGKAKETVKIEGHLEHTVFDASKLSDEQLAEAERLIESAYSGRNQG